MSLSKVVEYKISEDFIDQVSDEYEVYSAAENYAEGMGQRLIKCSLKRFFKKIHEHFYPELDVSFMGFFLNLLKFKGKFVIHHEMLSTCGAMISTRGGDVGRKLSGLGMKEDVDYRLRNVAQPVKQGGFVTKKHYYLTPKAFKKCLMRAQKMAEKNNEDGSDVTKYCDYFLLLEEVYELYSIYQKNYDEVLLSQKDAEIGELSNTVNDIKALNEEQTKNFFFVLDLQKTTYFDLK